MGCQRMKKQIRSFKKIKDKSFHKQVNFVFSMLFSLFLLIAVFITFSSISHCVVAKDDTYIPAAPIGPESGFLDAEYEYSVYTTNPNAFWMFDWGDGTYSDWMALADYKNFITQSHSWNSTGEHQVRVKFKNEFFQDGVWSESLEVTISEYYEDDIPNKPDIPSGKVVGCTDVKYSYSTSSTDPKGNLVQFRFDWGDGSISNWTSLVSSGSVSTVSHIWKNSGEYSIKSQARDQYMLISSWSDPLNVTIELDSDNDQLPDNTERQLGSDPNDPTDINVVIINDVNYYIVYADQNVIFYNSTSKNASIITSNSEGKYLIDDNNDDKSDYVYDPVLGSIEAYGGKTSEESSFEFPWLLTAVVCIITGIIFLIFIFIKTGFIVFYEHLSSH